MENNIFSTSSGDIIIIGPWNLKHRVRWIKLIGPTTVIKRQVAVIFTVSDRTPLFPTRRDLSVERKRRKSQNPPSRALNPNSYLQVSLLKPLFPFDLASLLDYARIFFWGRFTKLKPLILSFFICRSFCLSVEIQIRNSGWGNFLEPYFFFLFSFVLDMDGFTWFHYFTELWLVLSNSFATNFCVILKLQALMLSFTE